MNTPSGAGSTPRPSRIRLLLYALSAEDLVWRDWKAALAASGRAGRTALQQVERRDESLEPGAMGVGYGETLRWFERSTTRPPVERRSSTSEGSSRRVTSQARQSGGSTPFKHAELPLPRQVPTARPRTHCCRCSAGRVRPGCA